LVQELLVISFNQISELFYELRIMVYRVQCTVILPPFFDRECFRATYMSNPEYVVKFLYSLVLFHATVYISPPLLSYKGLIS